MNKSYLESVFFVKKLLGIPYIVFGHGTDVYGKVGPILNYLKKIDIKNANRVVMSTIHESEYVKKRYYNRGVDLVRNGISVSEFKYKKEQWDQIRLIQVGRLIDIKSYDTSLKAIAKIIVKFPSIYFTIIGSGREEKKLKELTKSLKLDNHITFLGQVDHDIVREKLTNSDIFIFPTYGTEACPLVVVEAMAAGLPIITTTMPANSELVEEGKGGFLIDIKNKDQLAEKIEYLIKQKKVAKAFGEFNKKKAMLFDWDDIARNLEVVYQKAVKKEEFSKS